jgi:hypothetical protein
MEVEFRNRPIQIGPIRDSLFVAIGRSLAGRG